MRFLRTASTQRLLATIAGLLVAIGGGTAIAVAATSGGPVPAPAPLAAALHQALSAKAPVGITADIQFTNNLIGPTQLAGQSDPILSGATGRLWLTKDHARLELQSANGDAQVIVSQTGFWVFDPMSNTVYKGTWSALGLDHGSSARDKAAHTAAHTAAHDGPPTLADIQTELGKLAAHLDIGGAQPTDVAGQAAYRVAVSPKHDGGLLGDVQLAWDAIHGVPLDVAIYAAGNASPVLELQATGISYGPVADSVFAISPPPTATVTGVSSPSRTMTAARTAGRRLHHGLGRVSIQHLSFALADPAQLGGLARQSVKTLTTGGSSGALVLYGKGLGGIAVIEHAAKGGHAAPLGGGKAPGSSAGGPSLNLPTVSINGATGQELATPLGSVLTFTHGGVSYTLIGSVPAAAIEAAARQL